MKADPRRQIALLRRINSPVLIPVGDYKRADAAVRAWFDDIIRYFDIDPSSPDRWEQLAWYLAPLAFPHFRLVASTRVGAPEKSAKRAELLSKFEGYQASKRGSKYKHFRADHRAACAAAGIKTENGLKDAILKAQRERKMVRERFEFQAAVDAIQAQVQRDLARTRLSRQRGLNRM